MRNLARRFAATRENSEGTKELLKRQPEIAPLRQRGAVALASLGSPKLLRYFATELIKDEDQPMIGMCGLKCRHHFLQGALVLVAVVRRRKFVGNSDLRQTILQDRAHDVAQGHSGGTNLGTDHAEMASDVGGSCGDVKVARHEHSKHAAKWAM
jgi:hypothetical protein